MYMIKVGAPKGLYVYWLHMELCGEFTKAYEVYHSKSKHNYRYARYDRRILIDEFLVVRTSKRCYRVIYFNADYNYFTYFSESNYADCANHMKRIYYYVKTVENKAKVNRKSTERLKNH